MSPCIRPIASSTERSKYTTAADEAYESQPSNFAF
jgi:hypothetical protein